jgi:hypothetical protein
MTWHFDRTAVLVLVLGLIAISLPVAGAELRSPVAVSWRVENTAALESFFSRDAEVRRLVNLKYNDPFIRRIGEYGFFPLKPDGSLALVMTIDLTGRAFFTQALVIFESFGDLTVHEVDAHGASIEPLADAIVDLDGDGWLEIMTPRLLLPYAGWRPIQTFTDIHRFDGLTYVRADPLQFRDFYLHTVLPSAQRKLAEVEERERRRRPLPIQMTPRERAEAQEVEGLGHALIKGIHKRGER